MNSMNCHLLDGVVEVSYTELRARRKDGPLTTATSRNIVVAAAMSSLEIRLARILDSTTTSLAEFIRVNIKPWRSG
jgi:hypothetical protein